MTHTVRSVAIKTGVCVSRFFFAVSRRKEKAHKKKRQRRVSRSAERDKASRLDCASF